MFQPNHHLISVAHSPLPLASAFDGANPRTAWAELEVQATFGAEVRRGLRAGNAARKAARKAARALAFGPSPTHSPTHSPAPAAAAVAG